MHVYICIYKEGKRQRERERASERERERERENKKKQKESESLAFNLGSSKETWRPCWGGRDFGYGPGDPSFGRVRI